MANPEQMLPRAIMTAIGIVIILYVAIAVAVFGNMPAEKVIAAKDLALAVAAQPIFGETGFRIVAIAALFSTFCSGRSKNLGLHRCTCPRIDSQKVTYHRWWHHWT